MQDGVCVQQHLKSVSTSAQSDQSLSFPPEEALGTRLLTERPIEDSDQTARMRRLIRVFDERTFQRVPFSGQRFIYASVLKMHSQ